MKAVQTFDYGDFATDTRLILMRYAEEIKRVGRRIAADIVYLGTCLNQARALIGYGKWEAWLTQAIGLSPDSAARYMQVAAKFEDGSFPQFAERIAPSILYILAAPTTPALAIERVLDEAKAGKALSVRSVREIVRAAKEPAAELARQALDTLTPPTIAINAAQEILLEYEASGGFVTLSTGEQVPADDSALLAATRAAVLERKMRQQQHVADALANLGDPIEDYARRIVLEFSSQADERDFALIVYALKALAKPQARRALEAILALTRA